MTTHQSPHSNNDQPLYNLKDFDHFGRGDYTKYSNWCVLLYGFGLTMCIRHLYWNLGVHK